MIVDQLPSIKNLHESLCGLKYLALFLGNEETNHEIVRIESEISRIVDIVGGFYNHLGHRNWIFSDYLNLDRMESVSCAKSDDEAEAMLISYLRENEVLASQIRRLNKYPDMRPRLHLLEKAAQDYIKGRFYSSILVTVSVADGFVNDINKSQRKGLHARTPKEMETEDSIATIPIGLPAFQKVFGKTVGSRLDNEVYEVMRHGLMHGMLTNYDNVYVASKAWCMLFAVCDWADDKLREQESSKQEENKSTKKLIYAFEAIATTHKKNSETQRLLDKWEPHQVDLNNPSHEDRSVISDITGFLESWKNQNYGKLSSYFPNFTHSTPGQLSGEARTIFSSHPIQTYTIELIERGAPSVATATLFLEDANSSWRAKIRFVKYKDNELVADWETGTWKAMQYGVDPFRECG